MLKSNFLKLVYCASVLIISLSSCHQNTSTPTPLTGTWTQLSTFDGVARSNAVGFTIGKHGYVGTGFDGGKRLNDFWRYDTTLNFWQQQANFPGAARSEAVGFESGGNGYVGLGYNGVDTIYQDFFQYDPNANTWTPKSNFGSTARYGAVAFTLSQNGLDNGYVGCGFDGNYKKDFWQYNSINDTWTQIVSIGGDKRLDGSAFVINNKAYVGFGINNGIYCNDFWQYDPLTGLWTQMAYLSGVLDNNAAITYDLRRSGACAFTISGQGYISTGTYTNLNNSTWAFNPSTNTWTEVLDFGGSARTNGVGLTIGNHGYVITGKNGNNRYDDFWEFHP